MSKNELPPEEKKEIESKNLRDPDNFVGEMEIKYDEDLIRLANLIFKGEAVSEIGKTEGGKVKWLKIHKIDKETDQKQELLLFIDDEMPEFSLLVQRFYQSGIEPESVIVPD